jgi:hypothetical protein
MKHLVKRLLRAKGKAVGCSGRPEIVDSRGPVVRNSQKLQARLTSEKAEEMVARYAVWESIKTLAGKYGVNRSTV